MLKLCLYQEVDCQGTIQPSLLFDSSIRNGAVKVETRMDEIAGMVNILQCPHGYINASSAARAHQCNECRMGVQLTATLSSNYNSCFLLIFIIYAMSTILALLAVWIGFLEEILHHKRPEEPSTLSYWPHQRHR